MWNVKAFLKADATRNYFYYLTDAAPAYKAGNGKEYGKKYITFFSFYFSKHTDECGKAGPP